MTDVDLVEDMSTAHEIEFVAVVALLDEVGGIVYLLSRAEVDAAVENATPTFDGFFGVARIWLVHL